MLLLYNLLLPVLVTVLRVGSLFSPKLKRGLAGRVDQRVDTVQHYGRLNVARRRVLVHVASFGELEQAKPVIAALKARNPGVHLHLTFFSPSGYDNVVGKYPDVDFISYLPLDYRDDVSRFLDSAKPDLVLFTRYDVWPNFADALARRGVPMVLFAATAAAQSRRMLPLLRAFHAAVYRKLSRLLVISEGDRDRFLTMGIDAARIVVSGDTRFDQVISRKQLVEQNSAILPASVLSQVQSKNTLVFVLGSSWPDDERIVHETLKQSIERVDHLLTIIAPHEPTDDRVRGILASYPGHAIRFSELDHYAGEPVIVVDSIGKLFGLYRSADVAMIGGGFSAGVHNVLEAAVWGVPVIVGPKHAKSQEVGRLIERLAGFEVSSAEEFEFAFWQLARDRDLCESTGANACRFVEDHRGATSKIIAEIEALLLRRDAVEMLASQDRS